MRNITGSMKAGGRLSAPPPGRLSFESLETKSQAERTNLKPGDSEINFNIRISIQSLEDIVKARCAGHLLVQEMAFSGSQVALVITAISELARNIVLYAKSGEIVLSKVTRGPQTAVLVTAFDRGPGIANLQNALAGGFSTSGGSGLGLCGLRHIVDEFKIKSQSGKGTQVTVRIESR